MSLSIKNLTAVAMVVLSILSDAPGFADTKQHAEFVISHQVLSSWSNAVWFSDL